MPAYTTPELEALVRTMIKADSPHLTTTQRDEVVKGIVLALRESKDEREAIVQAWEGRYTTLSPETDVKRTAYATPTTQTERIRWRGVPSNPDNHGDRGPTERRYPRIDSQRTLEIIGRIRRELARIQARIDRERTEWDGLSRSAKARARKRRAR